MKLLSDFNAATRVQYNHLKGIRAQKEQVLVAFPGGLGSTLLLKAAADTVGDRLIAVTALSVTTPVHEKRDAAEYARALNVRHTQIPSHELAIPAFIESPPKEELFGLGDFIGV
jgi:uncharacterized protein